jgi:hypothetical protein
MIGTSDGQPFANAENNVCHNLYPSLLKMAEFYKNLFKSLTFTFTSSVNYNVNNYAEENGSKGSLSLIQLWVVQ